MALQCHLMGGTFASLVQLLLFCASCSTLLLKRHLERPRRTWSIWAKDVVKQGLSANIIHLWNILASVLTTRGSFDFSAIPRVASLANSTNMTLFGPAKDGSEPAPTSDECELYLLTFALDTTVGLLITFYLMELTIRYPLLRSWSHPGVYTENELKVWSEQVLQWVIITLTMKTLIALLIFSCTAPLQYLGHLLLQPLETRPRLELVVVMLIAPVCMNAFQFWVNDNILMGEKWRRGVYERLPQSEGPPKI
mmetsp:Transcript_4722/g.9811  ORF Transcript_4722/g.9811 Transcript_4722/m.9811 type:complete len:252 (-) Transcript_4722:21-776(-)